MTAGGLGVFGGTFDPIHLAHLAVAEAARDTFRLRRVLFIPAAQPPHKPGRDISPVEHRLAMVEVAVTDDQRIDLPHAVVAQVGQHRELAGIAARWERRARVVYEHMSLRAHDDGEPLPHIQHRHLEITDSRAVAAVKCHGQA